MSVTARRTIAEDSLGHHPEVRMKAPESAWGVRGARLQAAEVTAGPGDWSGGVQFAATGHRRAVSREPRFERDLHEPGGH